MVVPPLPADPDALTPRERVFIESLITNGGNQRQAYIAARGGDAWRPSGNRNALADKGAAKILARPRVTAVLAKRASAVLSQTTDLGQRLVARLEAIALADYRRQYDEHGRLIPFHLWPADLACCVTACDTVRANVDRGDGRYDQVLRVHWADSQRAIELLMRYLKMSGFQQVGIDAPNATEVRNWDELVARLRGTRVADVIDVTTGRVRLPPAPADGDHADQGGGDQGDDDADGED